MPKDKELHHWEASVTIDLDPRNRYDEPLPSGDTLSYTFKLTGKLSEIMATLESIKEQKKSPEPTLCSIDARAVCFSQDSCLVECIKFNKDGSIRR